MLNKSKLSSWELTRGSGAGSNYFFSDDAEQNAYYFDDAKTKRYVTNGGNQPSIDGNFDDSVEEPFLSYVLNGTTSTPSVTLIPRRTTAGTFITAPGNWGIYFARLNNMSGKTPTVTVSTLGNYFGFLGNNGWYSYDRTTWFRFDNATPSGNTWNFTNNSAFTSNTVYVCYNAIFSGPQIKDWLTANDSSGFLHQTPSSVSYGQAKFQIGTTNLGYPIYAVRISDDTQSPAGGGSKKRGIVIGGTHASEVCGSWNAKGFADFMLSSDPIAVTLRAEFEFWVCFQTTPETRAKGKFRYTFAEDVDPNRRIPNVDPGGGLFVGPGHEMAIVVAAIQNDFGVNGPIVYGCDFHGGVFQLYGGGFYNALTATSQELADGAAFIAALEQYAGTGQIHDYGPDTGGYLNETGAGWFHYILGARYSVSAEMGTTAITSIQQMTDFGVYVAKACLVLYPPTGPDFSPSDFSAADFATT